MAKLAKPTTQISGSSTVITPGSPKLPDNPTPRPTLSQLIKKPATTNTATPNVLQANTGNTASPTQNATPPSGVGDNDATRTIFKQSGNPIVGVRDFTAGKGYGNAVDWDGENVTIGGQIVKPMYVKDGTAYADTNSVMDAITEYENQNGIQTNKGVLDGYMKDIKPRYEGAMDKILNRQPHEWNSETDEAFGKYKDFHTEQANDALRRVLEQNNTSLTGASGAVLSEAMAARDNYLNDIDEQYKEFEQKHYDRYLDSYDMLRNDLSDITTLGSDYYDKMYTANRDAITDAQYAGETERKDQQQWFENDIVRQEQNRLERELAMKELLAPLEREGVKLTNEGLGLSNIGIGLENEGIGLENEGLKETNRAAIIQNREDEAVRRGFWLPEDEAFFPWLSKYRKEDGTYSISPHYGEAMYNYLTGGASEQASLDAKLGLYNAAMKQYLRGA